MQYDEKEPWTLQFKNSCFPDMLFSKTIMSAENSKFVDKQEALYQTATVVTVAKKKDMMYLTLPFP